MTAVLDNATARSVIARGIDPIARGLLKIGLTADAVTWIGALAVVGVATFVIAPGHFVVGAVLYGLLGLSDLLDGTMARLSGTSGPWGAFLDSTLDRIVDASMLIAITLFYVTHPAQSWTVPVALVALVAGQVTSYIRARAEALGATCHVGLAERAERSVIIWLALISSPLNANIVPFALVLLAIVSVITVVQRLMHVKKQLA